MCSSSAFNLLLKRYNYTISSHKLLRTGVHLFSCIPKSSKSKARCPTSNEARTSCIPSLFYEISNILGDCNPCTDKGGHSPCDSKQVGITESETESCSHVVCGNAGQNMTDQIDGTEMGKLLESDIFRIVSEVTMIVRDEGNVVPMEERLATEGFLLAPVVVVKVLQRCFKVPHLALRFFNWVKQKDGFIHTTSTYNTMLQIAREWKEFDLVEELLKEMEENSCEKDSKTWTILVSSYGESGMIGKALSIFEEMRRYGFEPDARAYEALIWSLCMSEKCDLALEFYREMTQKGLFLSLNMYKMLLNCIAKTENISSLHPVADDMMRACDISEHDACSCLLKSLCISGRIRNALELIRDMKDKRVSIDAEHFEILVKGLCRSGRITDALEIFDIMKRKNLATANVYGTIISGYLKGKEVCKALELFQSMRASGILIGVTTCTEIMQHLFGLNKYEEGCEIFKYMVENGIKPDAVAVMAMVAGHIKQNHISEAWRLFNGMEGKGIEPTWKCYSILVKELGQVSNTEEVLKVLNQMPCSNITIGDRMFHWIVRCIERKRGASIEEVKLILKKRGTRFHECNAVSNESPAKRSIDFNLKPPVQMTGVEAPDKQAVQKIWALLSSTRDWGNIEATLEKSIPHLTPELVQEVLSKCTTDGSTALRFFSWAGMRDSRLLTTQVYNAAIKIAGRGKDFKHMRKLYYEMQRRGCLATTDTFTIMIMQYGRAGLTEIALKFFEEMKASGFHPDGGTYKCLIIALCSGKGKKVDEAIKAFKDMIHLGFVPDKELAENYLACTCGIDNLVAAKHCVDSLRKFGFSLPLAFSLYIRALCQVGRVEEALREVDKVEAQKSILEQYTYGSIVHGLLKKRKEEEALKKVEHMKQLGINPTVHVYTSLIVHFFKKKQTEKVTEILQEMQRVSCEPTAATYTAIICGHMSLGETDKAWSVFRNMRDNGPSPDFIAYSKFISFLCEVGKSEDGLSLLSEMLDRGITPSTVLFRAVFFGLNREGKQDLARAVLRKKSHLLHRRKLSLSI